MAQKSSVMPEPEHVIVACCNQVSGSCSCSLPRAWGGCTPVHPSLLLHGVPGTSPPRVTRSWGRVAQMGSLDFCESHFSTGWILRRRSGRWGRDAFGRFPFQSCPAKSGPVNWPGWTEVVDETQHVFSPSTCSHPGRGLPETTHRWTAYRLSGHPCPGGPGSYTHPI